VFRKRIYRLSEFASGLHGILSSRREVSAIWFHGRMDPAFREKIMVAVAEVNGCRFCSFAHREWALDEGVSEAELAQLEGMRPGDFDRRTWLAVTYARSLAAEDFGSVDPSLVRELAENFSEEEQGDIEVVARAMAVANRSANTLDALSARRNGNPAEGSRLLDELVISAFTVLMIIAVAPRLMRYRKTSFRGVLIDLKEFSVEFEHKPREADG
jgi:AhpD family alkylhydroperoxidase